jgi:hypothetical protein
MCLSNLVFKGFCTWSTTFRSILVIIRCLKLLSGKCYACILWLNVRCVVPSMHCVIYGAGCYFLLFCVSRHTMPLPAQSFLASVPWDPSPRFLFSPRHARVSKWGLIWFKHKTKLHYDWRSFGQSISMSSAHVGPKARLLLLLDNCRFLHVGHSDERMGLTSTVILGCGSRGTHDQILLSQIGHSPYLEGQVPIFISLRHWVTFTSPPTTRRDTVEVVEPASSVGNLTQVKVMLWPKVSRPVCLHVKKTRFFFLLSVLVCSDKRKGLSLKIAAYLHQHSPIYSL